MERLPSFHFSKLFVNILRFKTDVEKQRELLVSLDSYLC